MPVAECGIRKNLAKYYGQKSAPARLEGVGGEAGQASIFFTQAWTRGLNGNLSTIPPCPCDPWQDSQNDSGVEFMKRVSNTQASRTYVSRTYAEREEHDRISAHLDQALEMTFPCSDPVAIQLTRSTTYSRRKAATDFGGKLEPVVSFKGLRGRA